MDFKEWCKRRFGILSLFEGILVRQMFLPLNNPDTPFRERDDLPLPSGLPRIDHYSDDFEGKRGFKLAKEQYDFIIEKLERYYDDHKSIKVSLEDYKKYYFSSVGVDYKNIKENNVFPEVHVIVAEDYQREFKDVFAAFYTGATRNLHHGCSSDRYLSGREYCYAMKPGFLQELYQRYLHDPEATIHQTFDVDQLRSYQLVIQQFIEEFSDNYGKMLGRIDGAHRLALDHDNSDDIVLTPLSACSAYATSLRIYAALNYSNLSPDEHTRLLYAANLLEQEQVGVQCLGGDAENMQSYADEYRGYCRSLEEKPILAELPIYGKLILDKMKGDADKMLQRFLPDEKMKSDSDVIILQGGGKDSHSAIFRIIKVGVMRNGQLADHDMVPHHYDYYKVEDNLGSGSHEVDRVEKSCTGTYVTKLEPFKIMKNGSVSPVKIDPSKDPVAYQKQMAKTLRELILVEHQLRLYRKRSPSESSEFKEWKRLNDIKEKLSGRPHKEPVEYFAQDPRDPGKKILLEVRNQKGYVQGSGSCTVFSLKSLMSSVLGPELTARHIDYLQRHKTDGHADSLKTLEKELEAKIVFSRLATVPMLSSQNPEVVCQAILAKIEAYERHLNAELSKYTGQQNITIKNKLKLIQQYREIMESRSDSKNKLLYFIECLTKKPLEGEMSAIEILSLSLDAQKLSLLPAAAVRFFPVKGKEFIKDIETILGISLTKFAEAVAKPPVAPPLRL